MWNTIEVTVDIDECLDQIGQDKAASYFGIGVYDKTTPLDCIKSFKRSLGIKRAIIPEDLKKEICQFINDNIYNCI